MEAPALAFRPLFRCQGAAIARPAHGADSPAVLDQPPRDLARALQGRMRTLPALTSRRQPACGKFDHVVGGLAPAQEKVAPVDAGQVAAASRSPSPSTRPLTWKPALGQRPPGVAVRGRRGRCGPGARPGRRGRSAATGVRPTSRPDDGEAPPAERGRGIAPEEHAGRLLRRRGGLRSVHELGQLAGQRPLGPAPLGRRLVGG